MGQPWIATLFGYCLGGGLELRLACHFDLTAQDRAQIGFPEFDPSTMSACEGMRAFVEKREPKFNQSDK